MQKVISLVIQFQFLTSKFSLNSLVKVLLHNWVWLFATPWTVARQASLSVGFPSKNTGVCCHFLLQRIFLTQGSNLYLLRLLHWQVDSLLLCHLESPWSVNSYLLIEWRVNWFGEVSFVLCLPFLYTKNFMKQTKPDWAQSPKAIKSNFCSNNLLIFQVLQVKV